MKYDNLSSFQRHVENTYKSGAFPPVYLFSASDISRWMMEWMVPFFKGVKRSGSVADLTPSLFGEPTLVILECEEMPPEVEAYLKNPTPRTTLLLSLPKIDSKKVEKIGVVLQPAPLKPWERESFFIDYLMRRASSEKVGLANDAAKAIVSRSGSDPFQIDASYEKLTLWKAEERRITLTDVNTLGPFDEEETIFKFTDALFLKQGGKAMGIGQRLLEQGSVPLALLKAYRTQCCLLYELKVCLEGATAKHPYLKGNILEQKLSQARGYTGPELKGLLLKVDELERHFKNSSAPDEVFLEYAIVSLSQ